MTANNWLALFIVGVVGVAAYAILTRPEIALDEFEALEEEWWG